MRVVATLAVKILFQDQLAVSRNQHRVELLPWIAFAVGAGSEMCRAMGIAVFSGMLGVTAFGLFLTAKSVDSERWRG